MQLFNELKKVGEYHNFSAGLLIGGRKDVDTEKECVNNLNILVCTPGRLLQHMDETPNFDCSQLQVKVRSGFFVLCFNLTQISVRLIILVESHPLHYALGLAEIIVGGLIV